MVDARALLARMVLALWLVSAVTLLVSQGVQLAAARPEEPVANVVARCRSLLGPGETLGVVYFDADASQYLVAYRLAERLYPAVTTEPYLTADGASAAVEKARARGPSYLLVLGAPGVEPAGGRRLEPPAPDGQLFRLEGRRP
jgi:hypothetical protein